MSETIDGLKQRLVGAFVILSLAIIFLPMVFDKPRVEKSSIIIPVPPVPEFKAVEIKKPSAPHYKVLEIDSSTNKIVNSKKNSLAESVKKSMIDASGIKKPGVAIENVLPSNSSEPVAQASAKTRLVLKRKMTSLPDVSDLPVFKNVWMVQLGTFSLKKNAYRLRDRLRNEGFESHTKNILIKDKAAVRVFTGPFVNKREALRMKKKLDAKYKVDSRIVFFDA